MHIAIFISVLVHSKSPKQAWNAKCISHYITYLYHANSDLSPSPCLLLNQPSIFLIKLNNIFFKTRFNPSNSKFLFSTPKKLPMTT